MRHSQMQEMLSAYLDGEAEDPGPVRRLIEQDPEAARLYGEMKRLSNRLGALPEPEVPAQFLTRVMTEVREERAPRTWRYAATVAAMAAMVLIILGMVFLRAGPEGSGAEDPRRRLADNGAVDDVNSWLAENQALFDVEWDRAIDTDAYAVASADVWLGVLAEEEWFPSFAWSVESKDDIDALLGSLTEGESETLKKLLLEYAGEELST